MSFIVRYQSDTATEHELFETLDEALARVESVHNDPATAGAMLFKQVPLKIQTVVRVSIGEDEEPAAAAPEAAAPPVASAGVAEPPPGAMPLAPATVAAPPPGAPPPAPAAGSEDAAKRRFSR